MTHRGAASGPRERERPRRRVGERGRLFRPQRIEESISLLEQHRPLKLIKTNLHPLQTSLSPTLLYYVCLLLLF